ncbi:unnamed protein product [Ascophyllum nodosum]
MSKPRPTSTDAEYYTRGSYQQGGDGERSGAGQMDDRAYAERLQQEEFRNAQQFSQALPTVTVTGHPVATTDGTQYVAMYPPSNAFDPADLGVSGNFMAPHEVRLMQAFAMGRTVRILAILDGILLLLQCAWYPILFLLLAWAPLAGWMAGTRFSTAWTYAYAAYCVLRLSNDLAYIIIGYYWSIFTFLVDLIIARYVFRFARTLNSLTPAEAEQLRNPTAVWSSNFRRRPFQML